MKKLVLVIAVAALLVPTASTVAMQARVKQAREAAAQNAKKLSEWTGSLMHQVGRAIGRQRFDQIPNIIKKNKKRAAGITGAAAVLAAVGLIVRFFPKAKKEEVVIEMPPMVGSPFGITPTGPQPERRRAAAGAPSTRLRAAAAVVEEETPGGAWDVENVEFE